MVYRLFSVLRTVEATSSQAEASPKPGKLTEVGTPVNQAKWVLLVLELPSGFAP
jgi:hypothetical protein